MKNNETKTPQNDTLNWADAHTADPDSPPIERSTSSNYALNPAQRPNPLPFATAPGAITLPPAINLAQALKVLPPRAIPLIDGLLRKSHKMILSGPSKIGKSHALIDLAIAVAEGRQFLGFDCRQGRVLYVNFEIDDNSFLHRFNAVYGARGIAKTNAGNIDVLNLRGYSAPLDKLVQQIIEQVHASGNSYELIILDPIYKLLTGDENAATDVARFCAQIDYLCSALDCSVVYCHHHSKGAQGMKSSIDRASGSGVFARDADAIVDLSPLKVRAGELEMARDQIARAALKRVAIANGLQEPDEDEDIEDAMAALVAQLNADAAAELQGEIDALCCNELPVALRMTATLREFAQPAPKNILFAYPITIVDETGVLSDCLLDGEIASAEHKAQVRNGNLEAAFAQVTSDGRTALIRDVAAALGVDPKTVRNHMKNHPGFDGDGKGLMFIVDSDKHDDQDD